MKQIRFGLIGCGRSASRHAARLVHLAEAQIVGCVDLTPSKAESLVEQIRAARPDAATEVYGDLAGLMDESRPDAVAIFTPHRFHYQQALAALQAGCHVFIEKPLSTNTQEAVDVARMGEIRQRVVGVGHQYRLAPSLIEARRRLRSGEIGELHLVTACLAMPWLQQHSGPDDSWRLDPKVSGGGLLADAGDHLVDALLWTTGQTAIEVSAFQRHDSPAVDLVTAATVRLDQGTLALIGLSALQPSETFELVFHGSKGQLTATDHSLTRVSADAGPQTLATPEFHTSIDADFVHAVLQGVDPCCPARDAVATVQLLESIARSAAIGQTLKLA